VDLVALDQLVRLLHAGAGVVGAVLDKELDLAAQDAALLVELLDRPLGALDLGDREGRQAAGDWVDETDLHRRLAARLDDEGTGELRAGDGRRRSQKRTALGERKLTSHGSRIPSQVSRVSVRLVPASPALQTIAPTGCQTILL